MYKNEYEQIICPFCGLYGAMEKWESKMNGESIYRCYECFAIAESLSDLNNNILVGDTSLYADMIGIKEFTIDANNLGVVTTKDFEKFNVQIPDYPDNGVITMYGKEYDKHNIMFEQVETLWNANDN